MIIREDAVATMSETDLDDLPLGIIRLDRSGRILYYNAAQSRFAHRTSASTVGKNFFTDVAPCTAVKDFQGRFNAFIAHPGTRIEPFKFRFRFGWGAKLVTITLVRRGGDSESVFVVVTPTDTDP